MPDDFTDLLWPGIAIGVVAGLGLLVMHSLFYVQDYRAGMPPSEMWGKDGTWVCPAR
jgi:hypothetical protein